MISITGNEIEDLRAMLQALVEEDDRDQPLPPAELPNIDEFLIVERLNPRFYTLLHRMAELHNSKQHDYCGQGFDPLANLRASEALGIPAWKGCLVRMSDKWMRLRNFARQEAMAVKDESFCDTCLDLAVYALHEIILFQEAHGAPDQAQG